MKFSVNYVSTLISIVVGMWISSFCLVLLPLANIMELLKLVTIPLGFSILTYLFLTRTGEGRELVQDFARNIEKKYGKVRFTVCFILIALGVLLLILTGGAYLDMVNWFHFLNNTWTYTFPQYVAVVPNPVLKLLTQSEADCFLGTSLFWMGIFLIIVSHILLRDFDSEVLCAMFMLLVIALIVYSFAFVISTDKVNLYHYWFNTFPNCELYCNTTLLAVLGKCSFHNVTLCKLFNATAVRIKIPLDNPLSFPCYYKYKIINGLLFYRLNKTCIIELVLRKLKIMKR